MASEDAPALTGVTSVRTRMQRSFLVLVLLLLATGLTGIVALATVDRAMERLVERDAPALRANASVLQALTDAESGERGFLVTGMEVFLAPFSSGRAALTGHLAASRRYAEGDTELLEAVEAEASSAEEWVEGFAEPVVDLRRSDATAAAALASTGEGRRRFDRFRAANAVSAGLLGRRLEVEASQRSALARERQVVEHLRDLDRVRQEVIGTMSHELRTPLTSGAGYVELLHDEDAGPLNDEQRRLLAVVERNADRLLRLSEDVLTLSSVESAGFRLQLATITPARMLASVREAMLPAAARRGVSLASEVAEDVGSIAGDEGQLERVLLNLVSNAVKFTPSEGA